MGKSNQASNSLLNLIFQGTTWPNIAQNASSSPNTNLWIALHTADPTPAGNQSSNEVSYTSYARVSVARSGSGWTTASGESVSPQAAITFPQGTGGSGEATFFSIGTAQTGGGEIIYSGPITPGIFLGNGIAPQLLTGTTIAES